MKQIATVLQILRNADGNPEVKGNYRAWADHTEGKIEFCDWSTAELTANIIAKNMFSQIDK